MPDNDLGQSSSNTSETHTSGATVDAGAAAPGPSYVYGADSNVAEWKKFKTPEELDQLTDQMYNAMVQGGGQPAAPAAQPSVASIAPAAPVVPAIPDADMWLNDPAGAAEAHVNARIAGERAAFTSQLAGIHTGNSQTARAIALQSNPDAFARWGPEIDMQMSAIPVEQRNFQMYSEAVKLVKGAHAAEISDEALKRAVADEIERRTAAGTIRSGEAGTSATATSVLDFSSDNLPDRWKHLADDTTLEGQVEFLRKAYPDDTLAVAKQKYLKLLSKGDALEAEANA